MRIIEMGFRWWIFLAVSLFGAGLVVGLVTPTEVSMPHEYMAGLEELSRILVPFSPLTAVIIFIKNISAMLISFVLSPLLGLVPVLTLAVNGWLIGFISVVVVQEESVGYILAGLLPHGIFELPALIIAQAAALSFGTMVILALFKRERRGLLLPNLKRSLRYLIIACALLLPAAIIETYVTPLLLS